MMGGRVRAVVACAMCALATGCVSEGPTRPERVDQSRRPTSGATPTAMLMAASQPVDLDADGAADAVPVTVYLFSDPSRFTAPFWTDGVFTFTLLGERGEVVRTWQIGGEEQRRGRLVLAPGPGYGFDLTLDAEAIRASPSGLYNIGGGFESAGGARVRTAGTATVRLTPGR